MLHPIPADRPTIKSILEHDFIVSGYMPKRLPPSALTVVPRLTEQQMSFSTTSRRPVEREPPPLKEADKNTLGIPKQTNGDSEGPVAIRPRPTIRKSLQPVCFISQK